MKKTRSIDLGFESRLDMKTRSIDLGFESRLDMKTRSIDLGFESRLDMCSKYHAYDIIDIKTRSIDLGFESRLDMGSTVNTMLTTLWPSMSHCAIVSNIRYPLIKRQ